MEIDRRHIASQGRIPAYYCARWISNFVVRIPVRTTIVHLCVAIVGTVRSFGLVAAEPPLKVDYARDVRPILSRHCFQCHGPDEKKRKAELRLDDRAGATRELPTGQRAIVPGKADQSELIVRITSLDASALSHLDFRVDRFQFDSCVVDFHLPVDATLGFIDVSGPRGGFCLERLNVTEPSPCDTLPSQ